MSEKIYQQLELILQWEGKLNTQHLRSLLGVSRPTASKVINAYKERHPENIEYNNSSKGYEPSTQFAPVYSQCLLDDYLALNQTTDNADTSLLLPGSHTLRFGNVLAQPKPEIMRKIFSAIKNKQRIDIEYASVSSPNLPERIISPHSLVFNGLRWHTRAWCEKNSDYRDFVLTRIIDAEEHEGAATKTGEDDTEWNTWISFDIQPDPRLSEAQQRIIACDYGMDTNAKKIKKTLIVRAATLLYWLNHLTLDRQHNEPQAQQIIVSPESKKKLKKWLPAGYWQNSNKKTDV